MTTLTEAKKKVRELSQKGLDVLNSPSLTFAEQKTASDAIDVQLKKWMDEVQSLEQIEERRKSMGVASWGDIRPDIGNAFGSRISAPSIDLSDDQLHGMYESAKGMKSFRAELKDVTQDATAIGYLPNVLMPGVVERRHEVRLLERFPLAPMSGPTIEYIRHASTAGTAGTVSPGALKPEVEMTPDVVIATAQKIAGYTVTTDELLADFDTWAQYVRTELQRCVIDAENTQILSGNGTAPNLLGLLSVPGLLTRDYGTDHTADSTVTKIDTIERAITDLRIGPSFVDATDIVMHPTTWSGLRRTKDTQGRYIVNPDPTAAEAQSLFSVPVFTTTTIAAGTAVVANLSAAAQVLVRQGITVTSSNSHNDLFQRNKTAWIAEERLALAVARPTAVNVVTSL